MSARSNTGVRASKGVLSKRMAEATAELNFDQAPGDDKKILECLGAAVIMRWGTLPTKIQRELFEHATSLADLACADSSAEGQNCALPAQSQRRRRSDYKDRAAPRCSVRRGAPLGA